MDLSKTSTHPGIVSSSDSTQSRSLSPAGSKPVITTQKSGSSENGSSGGPKTALLFSVDNILSGRKRNFVSPYHPGFGYLESKTKVRKDRDDVAEGKITRLSPG